MNRREILNELAHIAAITNTVGSDYGIPEAARRAEGLIREVESWPALHPQNFESPRCLWCQEGKHQFCISQGLSVETAYCKCPHTQNALQPPPEEMVIPDWLEHRVPGGGQQPVAAAECHINTPDEQAEQPAQWPTPAEHALLQNACDSRHIDTPDELLELLAGISSDPQVEGLSLAQKASTIALLHIAKALQLPQASEALTIEQGRDLARKLLIQHAQPTVQEIGELCVKVDCRARGKHPVQSPAPPQEPS